MIAWYCGASQGKVSWRRWEVQFQGATGLPRAASAAPNPGMQYLRRKRVQFQGATGLLHRRISGPKLAVYLLHADSA